MIAKNNPFNIRNSRKHKWLGQTSSRNGLCVFSDLKYGVLAMATILKRYYEHGLVTPRMLVTQYLNSSGRTSSITKCLICVHVSYLPLDESLKGDIYFVRLLDQLSCFEGSPLSWLLISEFLHDLDFKFPVFSYEKDLY